MTTTRRSALGPSYDRGVQYLAIRSTERLAEAGAVTSVGSRGDSYDALPETACCRGRFGRPICLVRISARFAETEIPVLCRIHARGERAADALTRTYTCHPRYYGFVYPETQQARETRIICRIHARRITLDAIHA